MGNFESQLSTDAELIDPQVTITEEELPEDEDPSLIEQAYMAKSWADIVEEEESNTWFLDCAATSSQTFNIHDFTSLDLGYKSTVTGIGDTPL